MESLVADLKREMGGQSGRKQVQYRQKEVLHMTLGEKILTLRKARGWSQEELAGRIGVTRQALSRWESDAAVPDTVNVVELSDLFGVSCDYLLREKRTEDQPAVPQKKDSLEQRIVAWVVTVLGAVGTLTTLILGCVLPCWSGASASGWLSDLKVEIIRWFTVWMERNLLWLPLFCWLVLGVGIVLLRRNEFSALVKDGLREASPKKIRQDLGLDDKEERP
jgi:transcriptional regulator with XRE-family HTH domain